MGNSILEYGDLKIEVPENTWFSNPEGEFRHSEEMEPSIFGESGQYHLEFFFYF